MKKKYTKLFRSIMTALFSALAIVLIRLVGAKDEKSKPSVGEFFVDFLAVLGCSYLTSVVISAANGKAMSAANGKM